MHKIYYYISNLTYQHNTQKTLICESSKKHKYWLGLWNGGATQSIISNASSSFNFELPGGPKIGKHLMNLDDQLMTTYAPVCSKISHSSNVVFYLFGGLWWRVCSGRLWWRSARSCGVCDTSCFKATLVEFRGLHRILLPRRPRKNLRPKNWYRSNLQKINTQLQTNNKTAQNSLHTKKRFAAFVQFLGGSNGGSSYGWIQGWDIEEVERRGLDDAFWWSLFVFPLQFAQKQSALNLCLEQVCYMFIINVR